MKLPPEIESGNIEYKLKIIPDDDFRLIQLATQLNWRLGEGNGIAYYYLGVEDDGLTTKMSIKDYNLSIKNINIICKKINSCIEEIEINDGWYKIRIIRNEEEKIDIRIIIIGNSNSGKTTFISSVVNKLRDNGKGSSRKLIFNHKHEIYSGITSSIAIVSKKTNKYNIHFIDTPGNVKYMKTMMCALQKYSNDIIILCINPFEYSKLRFYLKILKCMNLKFLIIFTKNDLPNFEDNKLKILQNIYSITKNKEIPSIDISNITHKGIKKFLNIINRCYIDRNHNQDNLLFQVADIINIPNFGKVMVGIVKSGKIKVGDTLIDSNSNIVNIESIYYLDKPCNSICNNQLITIKIDIPISSTDIILSNKIQLSKSTLLIKCVNLPNIKSAICIYNNQYCNVNIQKIDNSIYELSKNDNFINVSQVIFLKNENKYYFAKLF